jgi:excisionase family DNA binding protein
MEVTIEKDEVVVVRRMARGVRGLCPSCRTEVLLLTADEAATLAGTSLRTIYRWVEAGKLHYVESGSHILVCPNSLP